MEINNRNGDEWVEKVFNCSAVAFSVYKPGPR